MTVGKAGRAASPESCKSAAMPGWFQRNRDTLRYARAGLCGLIIVVVVTAIVFNGMEFRYFNSLLVL